MNKRILCAAASALLAAPVAGWAQNGPALNGPGIAAMQTDKLKSSLRLDEAQTKKVNEILTKSYTEMADLLTAYRGSAKKDPNALAKKLREVAVQKDQALGGVLTGNQMSQYKRGAPQRVANFVTAAAVIDLQLDKSQATQVSNINITAASGMAPILREMPSLRAGQRKNASDKVETILYKRDKQLQGVLTGDQWAKYQSNSKVHAEFMKTMLKP